MRKAVLAVALCMSLVVVGCNVSQFEAVLNEVGPAVSTIIQIVALVRGTPADTTIASKVSADVASIESIYNDWTIASAQAKPGLEGQIDAGFVTLNSDLNQVFSVAQVSDQNTQAKVTALVGLIETAVHIAEAAIPTPTGRLMAKNPPSMSANQLVDSYNKILVAKTGNKSVDAFTPKHKLHKNHSTIFHVVTLGL